MPEHESLADAARLEDRAERLRAGLRAKPGFLEMIQRSQEAEAQGKFLTMEQIREQFEIAD